jgi:Na+-translocating ferredoxin:NAD+ oxidoreductase RnfE subunit
MNYSIAPHWRLPLLIVLIVFFGAHTYLVTNGYTTFFYERLRDIVIALLALAFIILHGRKFFVEAEGRMVHLIFANLFTLIFTLHLLRLIFGGIKC